MAESYSVTAVLKAVDSSFSPVFKNAQRTVEAFNSGTQTSMGAVGKTLASVGGGLTKGVTLPLAAMGVMAAKVSMDFGAQMSRVQAISGATGKELVALKKQAILLGAKTAFSAKEAAEGMENLASAGMKPQQIMKAMPGVLDLAAVSGGNVANAAENAAVALNGFGLEASKSGHVADVFARAAADTNAEANDMGEALKMVAPQAHGARLSLEETAAAIGILSDAGVKGSMAGSNLGMALTKIQNPSSEAADAMKAIGFNAYDSKGRMKSLSTQVHELQGKLSGMTDEQKGYYISQMYGVQGGRAMNILLNAQKGKLDKLTKSLKNSDGSAAKMAKTMQDNAKSAIEQLGGSLESAAITIGDKLAPTIRKVADFIGKMVDKFTNASPQVQNFILTLLGIAAAVGPIMLITGKLMMFTANVKTAATAIGLLGKSGKSVSLLSKAFGLLKSPVFLVIAAISLLVVGFVQLYKHSETFRNIINTVGDALKKAFSNPDALTFGLAGGITVLIGLFIKFGKQILGALNPFKAFSKVGSKMGGIFSSLSKPLSTSTKSMGGMGTSLVKIGAVIGLVTAGIGVFAAGIARLAETGTNGVIAVTAVTVAIAALAGVFALLGPALTANAVGIGVFGAAVAAIGLSIAAASAGLALLINAIVTLSAHMTAIIPTLTALGVGFANMIVGFVTVINANMPLIINTFINMVTTFLTTLANAMPRLVQSGIQMILSILSGIAANVGKITTKAIEIGVNFLNALIKKLPALIQAGVKFVVSVLNGIAKNIGKLVTAGANLIAKFLNGIANNLGKIINAGVNIIVKFLNGIAKKIPAIVNAAMNLVDAMVRGIVQASGRLLDAGINLVNGLANKIRSRQGAIRSAALNLLKAIIGVFVPDSLVNAGKAIINGFLKGLKSAFGGVKKFVGGVADWIKDHKGPISYDRKLLIPAGNAIMQGLNKGLENEFKNVMGTVKSMTGSISDAFSSQSQLDFTSLSPENGKMKVETELSRTINTNSSDTGSSASAIDESERPIVINVHQNWTGDKVRTWLKREDAKARVKINTIRGDGR